MVVFLIVIPAALVVVRVILDGLAPPSDGVDSLVMVVASFVDVIALGTGSNETRLGKKPRVLFRALGREKKVSLIWKLVDHDSRL